jgi:alpha-ribazole phosphatase
VAETRLWLIRHAPVAGPRGLLHGLDAPADVSDAPALSRLKAELPTSHAALSSAARRAQETALALGLQARAEPAFNEQDFGHWAGRSHDEIRRDFGAAYDAFWAAPASKRPPGGESFVDQIARSRTAIDTLPGGDVIIVAHAGTVRAALAIALDLSAEQALRFLVDPWSLTRIDRLDDAWRVVAVNCA